jgi:hypothetical protein
MMPRPSFPRPSFPNSSLGTHTPETLFRPGVRNGVSRLAVPKQEFGNEKDEAGTHTPKLCFGLGCETEFRG